ncbi:interleukin-1 receptor-associated kinase 4-like [Glandiceps talaboti]
MMPKVRPHTYLRQLPYGVLRQLSCNLDPVSTLGRNWKLLACSIPNRGGGDELKYSQIDIQCFEGELQRPGGSPTEALLRDWGTQNATAQDLVDILLDLGLVTAAEIVLPEYVRCRTSQQQESHANCQPQHHFTSPETESVSQWQQPSQTQYSNQPSQTFSKQTSYEAPSHSSPQPQSVQSQLQPQLQQQSTLQSPSQLPSQSTSQLHVTSQSPSQSSSQINVVSSSSPSKSNTSNSERTRQEQPAQHLSPESIPQKIAKTIDLFPGLTVSLEPEDEKVTDNESQGTDKSDRNASKTFSTDEERAETKVAVSEAKEALQAESCAVELSFEVVSRQTNDFNDNSLREGGNRIGEGAFGTVYRGQREDGKMIAVKKLKEAAGTLLSKTVSQFKTEVEVLSRCQHVNLVSLIGYTCDGHNFCLIYDYMSNGSLQDRLMCMDGTPPLHWHQRLSICRDVARGICYLHAKNLIHRDIKSANVLLDENFVGKVGDFGLVRLGPDQGRLTHVVTETVIGTRAYMPMEAFQGIISEKLDTYSYGVVLLEVMTGLPVYDESRDSLDLRTHVDDNCDSNEDFLSLVDNSLSEWDDTSMTQLYDVAKICLHSNRKKRPHMKDVLPMVESLVN